MQVMMTKEMQEQMRIDADDINKALAAITIAIHRDRSQTEETLDEEVDDHIDWIHLCLDRMLTTAGALMQNKAMQERLKDGRAIDISKLERDQAGYYILPSFTEGVDYCDRERESWVWSIGRRKADGVILVSLASDLYQNPDFDCLWLR